MASAVRVADLSRISPEPWGGIERCYGVEITFTQFWVALPAWARRVKMSASLQVGVGDSPVGLGPTVDQLARTTLQISRSAGGASWPESTNTIPILGAVTADVFTGTGFIFPLITGPIDIDVCGTNGGTLSWKWMSLPVIVDTIVIAGVSLIITGAAP